jgi:5-methylcytosine-specific restriction enzyme subunit McrC
VTDAVVEMAEWQTVGPESLPELADLRFTAESRPTIERLARERKITITELRTGVQIQTTSFVGSVAVGGLTIRVAPKLEARAFATLIGYAIGLPQIQLFEQHSARLQSAAFQDLIIASLVDETTRLLARGIHRQYKPIERALSSPRGRILFRDMARRPIPTHATIDCRFYERDEDVLPNRVLLGGVKLAAQLAIDSRLRARAMRAAAALAESARSATLAPHVWSALDRMKSRLLAAYEPAFALIQLLMAGHGIGAQATDQAAPLPGFLFDMDVLFQRAVGRYLRESLEGVEVREQYVVTDLFEYQGLFNPRRKRSPSPRPDYVFMQDGKVAGIADAKYRDLWAQDLGRDMLYQLSIYALSQAHCRTAAIIYPASDPAATEARISVKDPMSGQVRAEVHLRPLNIPRLADLVGRPPTTDNMRRRRAYAQQLAFS